MTDENAAAAVVTETKQAPSEGPFLLYPNDEPAAVENTAGADLDEGEGQENAASADGQKAETGRNDDTGGDEPDGASVSDDETLENLNEWIAQLVPDAEKAARLMVPVKVDGQESKATLAEVVKNYQITTAAEKRLNEAKEIKAKVQAEADQHASAVSEQLSVAATLIQRAEKALDEDTAGIDWAKLRQEDPAEFAAKREEFKTRRESVESLKRDAAAQFQRTVSAQQDQARQQLSEIRTTEQEKLLAAVPEWKDDARAKAEKKELVDDLKARGFPDEDIMSAVDHRLIIMAREAMLYRRSQSKVDVAKKKLAAIPKVMKPGSSRPKPQPQSHADILYGGS